jgi:hypothetical protein
MTENMDNSMDGPIGDIEDLAHMNGDGDFDRYSNLSHEMEDDEGRLIIAEEDQIPGSISSSSSCIGTLNLMMSLPAVLLLSFSEKLLSGSEPFKSNILSFPEK